VLILTNLHPLRLNDSTDSQWWEFSIASYNGHSWLKHCVGRVSAVASAGPTPVGEIKMLPRKLDTFKVFNTLAKSGMQYGPAFQRLDQISTDPLATRAMSSLTKNLNGDETKYHLHPTVIDAALQMGLVAARSGKLDASNCAAMPTLIEDVTIFRSAPEAELFASASTQVQPGSGEIRGQFQVIANGKAVMNMPKAAFTPIEQGDKDVVHKLPISARLSWQPHVDFVDVASLIEPKVDGTKWTPLLQELSELCYIFFQRCIDEVKLVENPSIQRFAAWVGRQYQRLDKNHPGHALSMEQIVERAHGIGESMAGSPLAACADCILEVGKNIVELLTGEKTIVEVLSQDDLLTRLYAAANTTNKSAFLKSLAHARPSLRILELGGSTGQLASSVIKDLSLPNGVSLYFRYTFTDPQSTSLNDAKKQFQNFENMEFRVLDIAKDPAEQGFKEDDKYDLIVATNYVHATPSLSGSLTNIRKLLAPGGRLLLQELSTESKWINCILGFLDEWWVGENDGRTDEPYVSPERWEVELKRAGFAAPDMVLDSPAPYQSSVVIIARPEEHVKSVANKSVTVLAYKQDGKNVDAVSKKLESRGYTVNKCEFGNGLTQETEYVVSLLDEESPFFEDIDQHRFQTLQKFIANIGDRGLFWITRPSQMQSKDPRYATVVGAIRSIRHEDTIDFATCEVEDVIASLDLVADAFTHFQKQQEDEFFRPNYEYAIVDGTINVPRFYPFTFGDERLSSRASKECVSLVAEKPGRISSLGWLSRRTEPLVGDQVDIEVFYSELTSKVRSFLPRESCILYGANSNISIGCRRGHGR
jgi:SAM-dependent methyltransferase